MKKSNFTLLLIYFCFQLSSQISREVKPTPAHVNVAGTKISMLKPDGFTNSKDFLGYQHKASGSSIMVIDIPGPFEETSKGLTISSLGANGIEINFIDSFSVNGISAKFIKANQVANGITYTKLIYLLGTHNESVMINGTYPKNFVQYDSIIEKAILSSYYDPNIVIDPFLVLDYTLDISNSKLLFAKSMSNAVIYNIDGHLPTKSSNNTNLIVTKSFSRVEISDKKEFAINRLYQTPLKIDTIEFSDKIVIDNMDGYEIFCRGTNRKNNQKEIFYQVMLFFESSYYLLFATSNDFSGQTMEDVKKVVHTFKRK